MSVERPVWPVVRSAAKVHGVSVRSEHCPQNSETTDDQERQQYGVIEFHVDDIAVSRKPEIAAEMLAFMEGHGVKSVVMSDGLMGCPHQEVIDYQGQWCPDPACAFWHGRDRFTHELVQ